MPIRFKRLFHLLAVFALAVAVITPLSAMTPLHHIVSPSGYRIDLPAGFAPRHMTPPIVNGKPLDINGWLMRSAKGKACFVGVMSMPIPVATFTQMQIDFAMDHMVGYLASHNETPTIVSRGECTLQGESCCYEVIIFRSGSKAAFAAYTLASVHNGVFHAVFCGTNPDSYNQDLPMFRKIVSSFRWVN